jgi:dihydroorotase
MAPFAPKRRAPVTPTPVKTLIRNAQVVTPDQIAGVSVLLDGPTIADLDPAPGVSVDQTIDAAGLHLLPGIIDAHVHFRDPGMTHKEDLTSGSRACAKGGITTFLEMPNTVPATVTRQALEDKLKRAAENSRVNYGFFIGATPDNLAELQAARRTPGIKVFMGSSTGDLLVDDPQVLERIFAETTLPIAAHCEDEATVRANRQNLGESLTVADHSRIRDHQAALKATRKAVELARRHHHRFHVVHVSTGQEVDLLENPGPWITAEVCPHHLLLDQTAYRRLDTLAQMNPALKTAGDCQRLWEGLDQDRIQMVTTDHAPHTWQEKMRPYPQSPSGIPGVETSLALMLDQVVHGRCTLQQVVHWMCDAPARVWDMVNKGRIAVGYDADLVLVDMQRKQTVLHHQQWTRCGWSSWHGWRLQGWPVGTWVRGQRVYWQGNLDDSIRGSEVQFDHPRGGYWATAGG